MRLRRPTASELVLSLLCLMYLITYIDRVNIATAASEIRRELALTKARHHNEAELPAAASERSARHRLTQKRFLIHVFERIDLIDDIDEVTALRDAPEEHVSADRVFPGPVPPKDVTLPEINMAAIVIDAVEARERRQAHAHAALVVQHQFGRSAHCELNNLALACKQRIVWKRTRLDGYRATQVPGLRVRVRHDPRANRR